MLSPSSRYARLKKETASSTHEPRQHSAAGAQLVEVSRAKEERDFLARELSGALGLGGRDRKSAAAAERARINVTKAIKGALSRIRENSPSLGVHLDNTIRTGAFCSYVPDLRFPIPWRL